MFQRREYMGGGTSEMMAERAATRKGTEEDQDQEGWPFFPFFFFAFVNEAEPAPPPSFSTTVTSMAMRKTYILMAEREEVEKTSDSGDSASALKRTANFCALPTRTFTTRPLTPSSRTGNRRMRWYSTSNAAGELISHTSPPSSAPRSSSFSTTTDEDDRARSEWSSTA